jgi:hypothetical protein
MRLGTSFKIEYQRKHVVNRMDAVARVALTSLYFWLSYFGAQTRWRLGFSRFLVNTSSITIFSDLSSFLRRVSLLRHQLEIKRASPRNNIYFSHNIFVQATVQSANVFETRGYAESETNWDMEAKGGNVREGDRPGRKSRACSSMWHNNNE